MMQHYTTKVKVGYVIQKDTRTSRGITRAYWWYGPGHGFGTTSGGLDYSVIVFDSATEARAATRSVGYHGGRPVTVAEARATARRQHRNAQARARRRASKGVDR